MKEDDGRKYHRQKKRKKGRRNEIPIEKKTRGSGRRKEEAGR